MILFLQAHALQESIKSANVDQLVGNLMTLGVSLGKNILVATVIFFIGRYLMRLINHLFAQMLERRNVDLTIRSFLKSLVNILLMILLVISVVSALGVETTSFTALLASAGLALGMAMSGNLQNLAGGLIILLFKPYKVGDYIEAQSTGGTVMEIQIFHTLILQPDNKLVYIPNGPLSSGNVTNFSKMETRRVEFLVKVEYGTDVEKVKSTLNDIISQESRILQDLAPFIALKALGDSSVDFTMRVWVKGGDYWPVYFKLNEVIYQEFNKREINFPFPQLKIHQA